MCYQNVLSVIINDLFQTILNCLIKNKGKLKLVVMSHRQSRCADREQNQACRKNIFTKKLLG